MPEQYGASRRTSGWDDADEEPAAPPMKRGRPAANIAKRPAAALAVETNLPLKKSEAKAMQYNTFVSKHYHAAKKQASREGASAEEATEAASVAYKAAGAFWHRIAS